MTHKQIEKLIGGTIKGQLGHLVVFNHPDDTTSRLIFVGVGLDERGDLVAYGRPVNDENVESIHPSRVRWNADAVADENSPGQRRRRDLVAALRGS